MQPYKNAITSFFNHTITQAILAVLIVFSTTAIVIEYFYHGLFLQYSFVLNLIEYSCLVIFTLEYGLRFWAAEQRLKFFKQPFNLIDLLAIVPSYLELLIAATPLAGTLRTLRLIRLLRFSRALRIFKLFRYQNFFKTIFQYQDTILQSITPIIVGLGVLKIGIVLLEYKGWWMHDTNLAELFAIIGFALGIILSQKIGTTYQKFTEIEETTIRISGALMMLNDIAPASVYQRWAQDFLAALHKPTIQNRAKLLLDNQAILKIIQTLESQPSELTILYKDIVSDSEFCLSKAQRLTPAAYDTLLHQSTVVYLALIAVFIPGITGLISVLIATYILYGMYRVTQDLDSVIGGDYKLINIDLTSLQTLAQPNYDNSTH